MKEYFITILILLGIAGIAFGAPSIIYQRTIHPETDSTYSLGDQTEAWLKVYGDELCLTGDSCIASWPSGGGWATTSTDFWETTQSRWATTSADYHLIATTTWSGDLTVDGNVTTTNKLVIGTTNPTTDDILWVDGDINLSTENVYKIAGNTVLIVDNENIGVGVSLSNITTGDKNITIGTNSGNALTEADGNVGVGYKSLENVTTGHRNTAIGYNAGNQINTGGGNITIGDYAGDALTVANNEVAIGTNALSVATSTSGHVCIGYNACKDTRNGGLGSNVGIGRGALQDNTYGFFNTAIGSAALGNNLTGNSNMAFGWGALNTNVDGIRNVSIGRSSLYYNESGDKNVGIGYFSLLNATGDDNIGIGSSAGDLITSGSGNIIIGSNQDPPLATTDNFLNIGGSIYGDLSNDYIGIATSTPGTWYGELLSVDGGAHLTGKLVVEDGRVLGEEDISFSIASTTFDVYKKIPIKAHKHAITITDIHCMVDSGTDQDIFISDGTNDTETIACDTNGQEDDGSIANGTFTAREQMYVEIGTKAGLPGWLNVTITYQVNP